METELKIQLDAAVEARLRRHPALKRLREGTAETQDLVSIYHDTERFDLADAGIALRLRKAGDGWVQTVKQGARQASRGLFARTEVDRPAPDGRLRLDHDDDGGVYRAIRARADGREVGPVFETRVRRTSMRLRSASGLVELAIDRGEVVAGARSAPIREAELELVEGEVGAIFEVARAILDRGPLRFSAEPKSARGLALARRGEIETPRVPRKAGTPDYGPEAPVEAVVREILSDCLAQIADNMALVAEDTAPEGPHQLRVGLRRLRSALAVFRPVLGSGALAGIEHEAQRLGRVVGRLRDLDVLAEEAVAETAALGLDAEARAALESVIEGRRTAVRAEVRGELAAPASVGFVLDLAEAIETRGWRGAGEEGQHERLGGTIRGAAGAMLDQRHRKAMKKGRRIEALNPEGLHALRKELKKLRYASDMLGPVFPAKRVHGYLETLKALQDRFGTLNDAASAAALLPGPEAPWAGHPAAQRAAGWVLGALAARSHADRPALLKAWRRFAKSEPFWR